MSAVTRWTQYDISEAGVGDIGGTPLEGGLGTRGYSLATASVGDSFNIGTSNNRLYMKADGQPASPYGITLASGSELDPRFVAKDISEKMHNSGQSGGWDHAQCSWEDNGFKIYSGTLGSSSQLTVWSGTNTAHLELGFGTKSEPGGTATSNANAANYVTVSGSYNGFFDETYRIVVNMEVSIGTPSKGGTNSYTGTISVGGAYNYGSSVTYDISISTTNGTTMGAGTGNVPTMSWTSTGNADDGGPLELLYANYWYKVGTKGLMVQFTDAIFNTCDPAWSITCTAVQYAEGSNASVPVETAKFIWGSNRGDDADTAYTTSNSWTRLGSRGLYVSFQDPTLANFTAGDQFFVICTPPQPGSYDITNLNYGNVTVSTESPVRNVMFEIMSGAVEISTVKFGLQNHGTFDYHAEDETMFRFGTVGPGNNAGNSPQDGYEWWTNVTSEDMADESDIPPSYLYSTNHNLDVVADADSSEALGVSTYAGMVADPVWLNIKLGQSEVGANSTINYRIYFDYA